MNARHILLAVILLVALLPQAQAAPEVRDISLATRFVVGNVDYFEWDLHTFSAAGQTIGAAFDIVAPDGQVLRFLPAGPVPTVMGQYRFTLDGTQVSGPTGVWLVEGNLHGAAADGTWNIFSTQASSFSQSPPDPPARLQVGTRAIEFRSSITTPNTQNQAWNEHETAASTTWQEPSTINGAFGAAGDTPNEAVQEDPNNARFFQDTPDSPFSAFTLQSSVSCTAVPTMSITGAWLGATGTAFSSHIYRDANFLGTADLRSVAGATTTAEENEGAVAAGTDTETNIPYNNAAGTSYQFRIRTTADGETLGVVLYAPPLQCTPGAPTSALSFVNAVFLTASQAQCANDPVSFSIDSDLTVAVGLNDLDLVIYDAQTGTLLQNYDETQMFNVQANQVHFMADVFLPGAYIAEVIADVGGVGAVDLFDSVAFNVPVGDCIWHEPDLTGIYLALGLLEGNLTDILNAITEQGINITNLIETLEIVFQCSANCTINANLTTLQQILENVTNHRTGSIEIMSVDFEGYSFGELSVLLLFIAIFLWGGYTRQLMVALAGVIGCVLVTITTPDLPVKWLILLAILAAAVMAIRNSWSINKDERNQAEKES